MDHFRTLFFISLTAIILILWKSYWRLQIMYNSSILSLYTPDTFPIRKGKEEQYEKMTSLGFRLAKKRKIVIATMLRDAEHKIEAIKIRAERLGRIFGDYAILVVENDSTDGTRTKLLEWAGQNSKVKVLGCGINVKECRLPKTPKTDGHGVDRTRIEKMVRLRNIYLEEIKRNYKGYDYTAIWDLDSISSVYLDGVANSIGYMESSASDEGDASGTECGGVDVMCSYGIYRWGFLTLFYDTYAMLHKGEKFHIDMKVSHDIRKGLWEVKYDRGDDPVVVDSCFSGFSIYKTSSLLPKAVYYDMSDDTNLECEHVRLHIKMDGKKAVNPSMINFILLND